MAETSPRVLVLLAGGTEEMEFTITVDVLRRAGVEVTVAGVDGPDPVTCSRGVRIVPDRGLDGVADGAAFDALVLPGGGPGAQRFVESAAVGDLLRAQMERGGLIAAICAAPRALVAHGIHQGLPRTSHSSVKDEVAQGGEWWDEPVVDAGPLLTSRGPGTAFPFAFALVERLCGVDKLAKVVGPMEFDG